MNKARPFLNLGRRLDASNAETPEREEVNCQKPNQRYGTTFGTVSHTP